MSAPARASSASGSIFAATRTRHGNTLFGFLSAISKRLPHRNGERCPYSDFISRVKRDTFTSHVGTQAKASREQARRVSICAGDASTPTNAPTISLPHDQLFPLGQSVLCVENSEPDWNVTNGRGLVSARRRGANPRPALGARVGGNNVKRRNQMPFDGIESDGTVQLAKLGAVERLLATEQQ